MSTWIPSRSHPGQSARVVVVPDPQFSVEMLTFIFVQQIEWILAFPPALVLFLGDLVNTATDLSQWTLVGAQLARLTAAGIPWMVALGNHDYTNLVVQPPVDTSRANHLSDYVATPAGVVLKDAGHLENAYRFVTLGGQTWLVIGLEWGPRTAVVAWAAGILDAHPTTPAIVLAHCYLRADGIRSNWSVYHEDVNPHNTNWLLTPGEGTSDGEDLWRNLIKGHGNVALVVGAHFETGRTYRSDASDAGKQVVQVVCDYQSEEYFGTGWLANVDVDVASQRFTSSNYTHYRKRSRVDGMCFREQYG